MFFLRRRRKQTARQTVDEVREVVRALAADWPEHKTCYDFHIALKKIYPTAKAYADGDHVTSCIAGCLWDKNGCRVYPLSMEPKVKAAYKRARKPKHNG